MPAAPSPVAHQTAPAETRAPSRGSEAPQNGHVGRTPHRGTTDAAATSLGAMATIHGCPEYITVTCPGPEQSLKRSRPAIHQVAAPKALALCDGANSPVASAEPQSADLSGESTSITVAQPAGPEQLAHRGNKQPVRKGAAESVAAGDAACCCVC
jgi:hypothetical protein